MLSGSESAFIAATREVVDKTVAPAVCPCPDGHAYPRDMYQLDMYELDMYELDIAPLLFVGSSQRYARAD